MDENAYRSVKAQLVDELIALVKDVRALVQQYQANVTPKEK